MFTYAGSGDDLYQSLVTSANWQPNKVFSLSLSLPYVWNSGENKLTYMEYEAHGIGDVRLTAWADITQWLLSSELSQPEEKEQEEVPEEFLEDPFAEVTGEPLPSGEGEKKAGKPDNYAHFRFGLGVKFPTGDHKVRDAADNLLPSRFQPGWGVANPLVGTGYRQSFGSLKVSATLMYEISGGENSVDYKHGDIIRFDCSAFYPVYSKLSLKAGLGYSLTLILQSDRLGGQIVKNTNGTFHSINVAGVIPVYRRLTAALIIKMPFGSKSSDSVNDLDFQYTLSLAYRF